MPIPNCHARRLGRGSWRGLFAPAKSRLCSWYRFREFQRDVTIFLLNGRMEACSLQAPVKRFRYARARPSLQRYICRRALESCAPASQSEQLHTARARTAKLSLACMRIANKAHRAHLHARALHTRSCLHCCRRRCSADEMLTLPSMHSAATALARRARVPASIYHSAVSIHVVFWVRVGFFSSAQSHGFPH